MKPVLYLAALAGIAATALAQSFPGRIDAALVGDWQCGETRVFITRLGSIEMLNEGYRAGLFDADGGVLAILWDDEAREDWRYRADAAGMTLAAPDDAEWDCIPRE